MTQTDPPLLSRASGSAKPRQPTRRWVLFAAVAILSAGAAAIRFEAAPASDQVPAEEAARRAAALAAAGPLALVETPPGEAKAALERSGLQEAQRSALATEAAAGRVRLLQFEMFDSDAEDGDVAEVRSAGFSQVVYLRKVPQTLAVPVGPDNTIALVGVTDGGGGGVTVGLWLPSGPLALPPLSVGQVLRIPVVPGR